MKVEELPALVTILLIIELLLTAAGVEVEFAAIMLDYLTSAYKGVESCWRASPFLEAFRTICGRPRRGDSLKPSKRRRIILIWT